VVVSDKPVQLIATSPNDPRVCNYDLFEGQETDGVMVEHLPLIIVKD